MYYNYYFPFNRATSVITPTPTPSPAVFMETQMSSIVAANLTDRFISGKFACYMCTVDVLINVPIKNDSVVHN